jgi:Dolichyl-phosphate-mannose-protein mannosyltransferase
VGKRGNRLDIVAGVRTPIDRRDAVAIAALSLIGVGIPLWLATRAGAIGLPTLDDWLYMRAADGLFRTGVIQMVAHSAAVIGQLLLVQPFLWLSGGEAWAYTAFGLVMAAVGIACTYLLARRYVGMASATLVVLLVVAFPGFLRESASFMTDVPAYAMTALSLLLGVRWFQGDGGRVTLLFAVAAGLLAVSIREFAIAAPTAILVAAWARNRPDERWWLAWLTGISAVVIVLVLLVASGANRVAPGTPGKSVILSFAFLGAAFATLALALLPALVLFARSRLSTLRPQIIVAAAIASMVVALAPTGPILGNVWAPNGIGGDLLLSGERDRIFGGRLWPLFEQLAIFAAILGLTLIFARARPGPVRAGSISIRSRALQIARASNAPLVLFLALYAAELVVYTPLGPILDRYLYPMTPAAAVLLLRRRDETVGFGRSLAISHATFAGLAIAAFALAANSFIYDAARWREGEATIGKGYDARSIDAGYEWVGYHTNQQEILEDEPFVLPWYYEAVPADAPCAIVSNSLLEGGVLTLIHINKDAYSRYLFFGPGEPFYLYAASLDGCPPVPPAVEPWVKP